MFIMTGNFDGNNATVKYENGILSGDNAVIKKAEIENKKDHGYLGACPACANTDYLSTEIPAADLLSQFVFDRVFSEENDWYDMQKQHPDAEVLY